MSKKAKDGRAPRDGEEGVPAKAAPAAARQEPAARDGMPEKQVLRISRAIADPRRMAMLRTIAQNTATCNDLRECTSISAATLSHHLRELETAGLIETAKDGRFLHATLQKKVWKSYIGALKSIGA